MTSRFYVNFSVGLVTISGILAHNAQATDPPTPSPTFPPGIAPPLDPGRIIPPRGKAKPADQPKDAKLPKWLEKRIADWNAGPAGKANSHSPVFSYKYKGKLVYWMQTGTISQVFDADGKLLGMPSGGFTGKGDGKLSDFKEKATDKKLVWTDPKAGDKELEHYKQRIKRIEDSRGKAQALKSVSFWLRRPPNANVKKFLQEEKKRLENAE